MAKKEPTITEAEVLGELRKLQDLKQTKSRPGFTTMELAEKWGISTCTVRRLLRAGSKRGIIGCVLAYGSEPNLAGGFTKAPHYYYKPTKNGPKFSQESHE
jgi:hypothetical protein